MKIGKDIKVHVQFLPGQRCTVRNYRKKDKTWEPGKVTHVEAGFNSDGSYSVQYRVMLDRRTEIDKWGRGGKYLFLTVGDDNISI